MRGTCFWYHDPLTLCIMQMSLEFSDAELRRLRDHDALLTHVGITTLSDVDCQASMGRMLLKFATLSAQEIPKLKSLASFKILTFKDLKAAKMATATKEDAEPGSPTPERTPSRNGSTRTSPANGESSPPRSETRNSNASRAASPVS